MVEKKLEEQPVRYTSYHSDKTFSILSLAKQRIKEKWALGFEYNGIQYTVRSTKSDAPDTGKLVCLGPMYEYITPWCEGEYQKPVLATFNTENFDEFIETFEIEGKTVKWVLEHQKEWKYKLTAEHFEKILTGFSFWFIYRQMPCGIHYVGAIRDGQDITAEIFGNYLRGRYLVMYRGGNFDPRQYAPTIPGAEHWFDAQYRLGIFSSPKGITNTVEKIESGPFKTVGELLDTVRLNSKTLREIFDTEYDDGAVCCGMFDG